MSLKQKNRKVKNKNMNIQNVNIDYNNKVTFLSYCMKLLLVLLSTIKRPFIEWSGFINDWQQFKVSVFKVIKLLETESKIKDLGNLEFNNWNDITFDNVSTKYSNKQVIKSINLRFRPNKTYAFIGEIGSGKSTIGKLLLRLIDISNGEITINGISISNYTLESLRKNIVYVSQTPFLFSDTIANNVSFGNENLTKEEIVYYLKLVKADYVFSLPNDIDTIIGENGVNLSGGEKQRLSLARAIAKKPSILILDDITSALDFETELEVTNNINNLKYECTKIIIAPKIFSVKNADAIFVMSKGNIVEYGLHEELLQRDGIYKEIYDIQTKSMEECI